MSMRLAIIIGAALIGAAILIVFRWEIVGPGIMRLDRWTGDVVLCDPNTTVRPVKANCEPK
jgi:hypothetical protein